MWYHLLDNNNILYENKRTIGMYSAELLFVHKLDDTAKRAYGII